MPGEISRSNPGPKGGVPYVPSWVPHRFGPVEGSTLCQFCARSLPNGEHDPEPADTAKPSPDKL